ncbi:MAG: suppressor of fused domain protein [Planctomycetota bacterium]
MADVIRTHIEGFWPDNLAEYFSWELGPIKSLAPDFRVCRVSPKSPNEPWTYVSIGASARELEEYSLEFVLRTAFEDPLFLEVLAMVTHYHLSSEQPFDLGSLINFGRPWAKDSSCDHFLVSLPYPLGPKLEWLHDEQMPKSNVRFLWLMPIYANEAAFARTKGAEALEDLFEEHEIDAIDPRRNPVA